MNRVVTSRVAALMTAASVVVIAACGDTNGSQTNLAGPNASSSSGGSAGDSARNNPPAGNPGGGHPDTGATPKPNPKPVASFTLDVHVGSPRPGATDTLATDPIAGATVSVYEQTYTFTNRPGADTVNINQTLVGSGASDANGDFAVPNLKGTSQYIIKVAPLAGSSFGPASVIISQAYADPVKVLVTLHGR
jgi:hypothetical protein